MSPPFSASTDPVPEGDTLRNLATRLRPVFVGNTLRRVSFPRLRGMDRLKAGDVVSEVRSRGKYLEIEVERGLILRTHLRMTGSWEAYEPGARWRKPRHLARAVLETDAATVVCFAAPVVEIGRRGDDALAHLGPDLCEEDVDIDEILRRIDEWADPRAEIADVLLDQRLAAGIGNVYKCEALFACRVDPFLPLAQVSDEARRRLYETAAAQLHANLGRDRRVTMGDGLAVYGRERQGCRVCGTGVRTTPQGVQGRQTWWCPRCQASTARR
jgi:endonuclease-8